MNWGEFAAQEDYGERCERDFLSVVLEKDPQWPPLKGRNGQQPKRCRGSSQLAGGKAKHISPLLLSSNRADGHHLQCPTTSHSPLPLSPCALQYATLDTGYASSHRPLQTHCGMGCSEHINMFAMVHRTSPYTPMGSHRCLTASVSNHRRLPWGN